MSKIRFGIIGSGFIVERFLESIPEVDKFELAAFYSRNIDTAKKFQSKYNIKYIYTDLDQMATSNEIDAVYIASPNALHHDQTIKFLNNKKHVLCEKALASNAQEVKSMFDIARKNNVVLMEAMKLTTLPNFLQVKNNLHKIGTIRRCFMNYCQYSSRYDKYKDGIILNAFKNELSNGSLMDIGVYCIHPIVNLFGKPNKLVSSAYMLESNVDGQGSAIFTYDNMDAIVTYSKISNSHISSEIQGENGSIIIEKLNNFDKVKIIYRDGVIEDLTLNQSENNMAYEITEFINTINSNKSESNLNTSNISLSVMEIMDEIRIQIGLAFPADYL